MRQSNIIFVISASALASAQSTNSFASRGGAK